MEKLFGMQMTTVAAVFAAVLLLTLLYLAWLGRRNRVMFKLGLRPILRRRTHSTLIVSGLMLGTLIITAAFVTGDTLSHTIRSLIIEEIGPVDETIHVRSNNAAVNSSYFSMHIYSDIAQQLEGYPHLDAVVPGIRESIPAVNLTQRQSVRALSLHGLPEDSAQLILPEDAVHRRDGSELSLADLPDHHIYLNQAAAEDLHAQPGDEIKLYPGTTPRTYIVAGISAADSSPAALLRIDQAQALLNRAGRINYIALSNTGDSFEGVRYSEEVSSHLRTLLADDTAANNLFLVLTRDSSAVEFMRASALRYRGNTRSDLLRLASGLEAGELTPGVRSLLADESLGAEVMSILEQSEWGSSSLRRRVVSLYSRLSDFSVENTKRDGLDEAELAANSFTAIFIVTGLFGIASGVVLIFLIFVMLAAERKSEMGMTRAIGAQRGHLVQMFVYEGTAYDLAAAAVGVALGLVIGLLIAFTMGQAFASQDLQIRAHVTIKSLIVSYSLGMLVTFATVLFSARKVSRLNIVSAIRGTPEPPDLPIPLKDRLLAPFRMLIEGVRLLFRLKIWRAVRTWMIHVPGSILRLIGHGFRSGPLTLLAGLLLVPAGLNTESSSLFTFGASIGVIGAGLTTRLVLSRLLPRRKTAADRIAFTIMGLLLLVFWSLPSSTYEVIGISDLKGGAEMLFISGFMMIVGAVMVVMYNTDLLLKGILRVLGGSRRLAPVLRMAVAYPLASRFRTGLTLGMFGIVVFSVVFMATAFRANQAFLQNTEAMTGGFELRALSSEHNPVPDLARSAGHRTAFDRETFEAIGTMGMLYVDLQHDNQAWDWYRLQSVDDAYLENVTYDFAVMAHGYDTADDIWQALRTHPGYAVIDYFAVQSRQNTTIVIGGSDFKIEGIYLEDETMDPTRVKVRDAHGEVFEVTVIGVLDPSSGVSFSMMTSEATVNQALSNPPVPTRHYIKLSESADPAVVGAALESAYMDYGLETVDQIQEIRDMQVSQRAIEKLMLGFLTLGLIVGVAALGVISSRAVVERRQQIGVLRAIGFQAEMVTWSFLIEASFVALLGITLGAGLALIPASQMIAELAPDTPGLEFQVPWGTILLVLGAAYAMGLLATWLPARQAAQVAPAEALRYE